MTIKFCKICNNMYYMKIDGEGKNQVLSYFCKNCGDTQIHSKEESNLVLEKYYNKGEKNYKDIINKYTVEDPTLPRVNNIICPNKECPCNKEETPESREVIYIKYDNESMKYIYLCCICKTAWKNNSSGNQNKVELLEV